MFYILRFWFDFEDSSRNIVYFLSYRAGVGTGIPIPNFGIGIGLGITNSGQNPKKSQESQKSQEIPKVVVEISVNLISMNYLLFFSS